MLSVSHLRKTFDRVVAVDDISLEVQRGEMYGLLGPNGAGKTTTIRTILDIIKPDSGTISFDGEPFSRDLWNNIGYLPEERGETSFRDCRERKHKFYDVIVTGFDVR